MGRGGLGVPMRETALAAIASTGASASTYLAGGHPDRMGANSRGTNYEVRDATDPSRTSKRRRAALRP